MVKGECVKNGKYAVVTIFMSLEIQLLYVDSSFLTPERHEYGVEDGSRMVKEVGDLLVEANVGQLPLVALLAEGAHVELVPMMARLHGDGVGVHGQNAVEEDEDADDGGGKEPAGVKA